VINPGRFFAELKQPLNPTELLGERRRNGR
jgi:hypothetical protein